MSTAFIISYAVLWVLVAMVVLWMMRAMNGARRPVGDELPMQDHGIPLGMPYPKVAARPLNGEETTLAPGDRVTIVLHTSVTCGACEQIYPVLDPYLTAHPELRLILLVTGDSTAVADMVRTKKLRFPVVHLPAGESYQWGATIFPFAYLLSPDGYVAAKGVVNHPQHLDMLLAIGQQTLTALARREGRKGPALQDA